MKVNKKRPSRKPLLVSVAVVVVSLNALAWSRGVSLQGAYFMGIRAAWMLAGASGVQVLRLSREGELKPGQSGAKERIGRYVVTKQGVPLDARSTSEARRLLLNVINNRPFIKLSGKGCDPMPGVAFRVWSGNQHFDVLACFSCSMLTPVSDPQQKVHGSWTDFDEQRAQLLQIAKRALPHDRELEQS